MVFNDVASDTRVRYRNDTFYSGINLYAEIFFQKKFCELQNASKYYNNIKSVISPSFLKKIVILFNFF